MAIHINVGESSYKELSNVYLKQIDSYTEICKVYICTGPNQYQLLFDICETVPCEESDEECDDCLPTWSSFHDELLLSTDGPEPVGITKLICPTTACAAGEGNDIFTLDTTCMDDNICCKCGFDIFGVRIEPEAPCVTLTDINCPCLKLDNTSCSGLPKYITNTCQAYIWTALGGDLLEGKTSSCKSCIDSTRTVVGKCCRNGRRYSYIKEATWIKDPTSESDCGIKRNCYTYELFSTIYPDQNINIIDYGYKFDFEKIQVADGIAGLDPTPICPTLNPGEDPSPYCQCLPACCDTYCKNEGCSLEEKCQRMCNPSNNCSQFEQFYEPSFDIFKCSLCSDVQGDPCGCNETNPERCDVCNTDPCGSRCIVDCQGNNDWCSSFCTGNEINWICLWNAAGGILSAVEILSFLNEIDCPCKPNFDTCNDICYDSFGTNDAN